MKLIIIILGLLNGLYMVTDGIFVMFKSKYIGPEKPGPWANLFYKLNIDVFKLGPLFIVLGLMWLIFLFGLQTNQNWTFLLGMLVSIFTLWYLPIGTIISVIVILLLISSRAKMGL